MNRSTYHSNKLPNKYGPHYPNQKSVFQHLFEIFINLTKLSFGIILVVYRSRNRKEDHVQHLYSEDHDPYRYTMEEPTFVQKMEIQQAVKYAAILYVSMAMVAIPSGICSSSYQKSVFKFPLIVAHKASDYAIPSQTITNFQEPGSVAQKPADEQPYSKDDVNLPPFYGSILEASQAYEVDIALIRAIIMAESSNNPRAISHKGAQGLMQLMPITAKSLGVEDAFDPALNIDGGVRYFKSLLDRFNGDVKLALAAYNAGSRYVRKYGGVPPFKATRQYIKKVLKYRDKYQAESASHQDHLTMS